MAENNYYNLLENLEKMLLLERDEGVLHLDIERSVLEALATVQHIVPVSVPKADLVKPKEVPVFSSLEALSEHLKGCFNCSLCEGRTHVVPGAGNHNCPDLMFIGEGPEVEDDSSGKPFTGPGGGLLTKMIAAMGYDREAVFITTVVKCSRPKNRPPLPEETAACLPYLKQEIAFIRPKVIVALGAATVKGLLGRVVGISRMRGNWQEVGGIPMMPTYHPTYLLRDPSKKGEVWKDLQAVLKKLGKEPPAQRK